MGARTQTQRRGIGCRTKRRNRYQNGSRIARKSDETMDVQGTIDFRSSRGVVDENPRLRSPRNRYLTMDVIRFLNQFAVPIEL